jgi:hypothetical protein
MGRESTNMNDNYIRNREGKIIGRYDGNWLRDGTGKLVARYDKSDNRTRTREGRIVGTETYDCWNWEKTEQMCKQPVHQQWGT